MNSSNALMIFAKLPRAGEVKTRLGATMGMGRAGEIYAEFARHAFALGRNVQENGAAVYLMYDPASNEENVRQWVNQAFRFHVQTGKDLGERMRNAMALAFRDGFSRSVIIGTDVPELDAGTVADSFNLLETVPVVLGPSKDGGYYLLGMHVPMNDLFEGIPWSTGRVLDETTRKLKRLGVQYRLLQELADIDTEDDYRELMRRRTRE